MMTLRELYIAKYVSASGIFYTVIVFESTKLAPLCTLHNDFKIHPPSRPAGQRNASATASYSSVAMCDPLFSHHRLLKHVTPRRLRPVDRLQRGRFREITTPLKIQETQGNTDSTRGNKGELEEGRASPHHRCVAPSGLVAAAWW